jgi:hypothetical protein
MTQVFLALALAVPAQNPNTTLTYRPGGGGSFTFTVRPGVDFPPPGGSDGPVVYRHVDYQWTGAGLVAKQDGKTQYLVDPHPFRVSTPAEVPASPPAEGHGLSGGRPQTGGSHPAGSFKDRISEEVLNFFLSQAGQPQTKGILATVLEYVRDEVLKRKAKSETESLGVTPEVSDALVNILMAVVTRSSKANVLYNVLFDSAATVTGDQEQEGTRKALEPIRITQESL